MGTVGIVFCHQSAGDCMQNSPSTILCGWLISVGHMHFWCFVGRFDIVVKFIRRSLSLGHVKNMYIYLEVLAACSQCFMTDSEWIS